MVVTPLDAQHLRELICAQAVAAAAVAGLDAMGEDSGPERAALEAAAPAVRRARRLLRIKGACGGEAEGGGDGTPLAGATGGPG